MHFHRIRYAVRRIQQPSKSGGPYCLSRIYAASGSRNFNQKRYASGENQPPRRIRKLFYTTVGLTLIGVGGVVVYAKSDPKFRKVLDSYVPGTDTFIRIIYQEEGSFNLDLSEQLSTIQDKVLSIPSDIYKQISGSTSSEKSPALLPKEKAFKSEETGKPQPKQTAEVSPAVKEIKVEAKVEHTSKPAFETSRKAMTVVEVSASEIKSLGDEALKIYTGLISAIQEKSNEIINLIDTLDDSTDTKKSWKEIRGKMDDYIKFNEELDKKFNEAGEKAKKFSSLLKKVGDTGPLKPIENDLNKAKENAEDLKQNKLAASLKYIKKIEETLQRSSDELMILFPNLGPGAKSLKLTDDEIDLFLYYAFHKLIFYQKELAKMDAVINQKVKKAISSKDDAQLLESTVEAKVGEGKRKIRQEFDKKMLELKKSCDDDVHNSLKRQEQVHLDILKEQLALKEKEVERKLIQKMEEKVLEEQVRLQAELGDMTGRMKGLNEAIAKRALQDQKAQTSQALWSAAEALYDSLKHGGGGGGDIAPLKDNIQAIRNASAKGDDLVETVLATIPSVAVKRGVYPEDALRERFLKVEKVAWRVAGVPEGGASLPKLLVAWLQSILVIKASEPIPSSELNNEPFDPESLNNYDILQRARYYVDRGDYDQALKYMNLLKGGARAISSDWMKETTVLLETQQAAHLLLAHASASGMIYS